jgi:parallel beta-helix repeat protein
MAKRLLIALVSLALIGAAACGDSDGDDAENNGNNSTSNNNNAAEPFSDDCTAFVTPSEDGEENRQNITEHLVDPSDGDVICLGDGTYPVGGQLTLNASDVADIEIRGQSQDGTILDFDGQSGSNGVLVDGIDDFRAADFTIKNTAGDAIKVQNSDGVELVNLTVTWDRGPHTDNGAYGVYPVLDTNVLVEGCEVSHASDAGIYVGQSDTVIVRNNVAFGNVAGLEIENTSNAEVHDNHLYENTGGLLVFNLPDLQVRDGSHNKIHSNLVENNNQGNFAESGTIVSNVPAGVGILLLSTDNNEVHDNEILANESVGVAIISYLLTGEDIEDPDYDPFSESNYVHDNTFRDNGNNPGGLAALFVVEGRVPDLVIDGIFNPEDGVSFEDVRNCFEGNAKDGGDDATFVNIDFQDDYDPDDITDCSTESTDFCHYQCTGETLPNITLQ